MDTEELSKHLSSQINLNNNTNNSNSNINPLKNPAETSSSQTNQSQPSSPRRRKQPLDLDTALYLQSQARDVQEPNERLAGRLSAAPSGPKSPKVEQFQSQSRTQSASAQTGASSAPTTQLNSAPATEQNNKQLRQPTHWKQQQQQQFQPNQTFSVDYIDCLSNTDLLQSQQLPMRGIPSLHCRKHLRFHRNRVEPSLAESSSEPQAQQQHFNDAATTTTTGDSFSNVLSSICSDSLAQAEHSAERLQQQQQQAAQSSVLYPISVSEVKKRTYFIGSISQDSLLGHDELYRHFPNGRVNIFVCTWNQNRKRAPLNLNDLLLPDQLVYMPDIYAIGIQEAFSSQTEYLREWDIDLQTTLGPSHVLLHSCSLGVLHLSLFVRRDLIWFCSSPEESLYNSRSMPTNMIKTKGAVSIAFRFFGTSFMFTNCHFPAHENKLKDRVDEYQRIINSIDLPKNLKLLKPRYLSNDSTARFDCVFFMGDLNFRLEQRTFDETIQILDDIFHKQQTTREQADQQQQQLQLNSVSSSTSSSAYEALTQNDELLKVMESNQAFHGFDESQIKFPPTYKFLAQTNKYDRQTKRVPSYTDRILFRSKRQRHIQCLIYDWLPQLISSDHKPVYCLFNVLVRPGHEQQNMVGSLNAGLFQRAIYLEALKRRAQDPEAMREDGAGGSLICSIS